MSQAQKCGSSSAVRSAQFEQWFTFEVNYRLILLRTTPSEIIGKSVARQ